ncbi:MAG: iron-sulfur cluster assembly scaffold protein [Sedimentisphaerales bacterium]|nr:iron-sulfur cluster assembly scaffold protein [Sedimentisphaerales bacterium]
MEEVQDEFFGRMNDPTAGAWLTGPCGDTMEFYLVIEDQRITYVRYHTDGCEYTRLCGRTVSRFILDKSLQEALTISATDVLTQVPDLPPEHRHCAILAISTFYKAIAQFWLEQARS